MAVASILLALELEQDEHDYQRLLRKEIRESTDPFAVPEERFIELYRLNKSAVRYLIGEVEHNLPQRLRLSAIPVAIKVCAALRYYVTGSYQKSVGQEVNYGLSQTSVCRIVAEITDVLSAVICPQWVKFPQTNEDINEVQQGFMDNGFPGCVGAIDCTHIAILKPSQNEHTYVNSKGYHSINAQIIVDSNLRILNINARYPGATHDSFIWNNSRIKQLLIQRSVNGHSEWLIGDSGYPNQPYVLTPILTATAGTPEARYNIAHGAARNCVQRSIALLKCRFRCLLPKNLSRYKPTKVSHIINVCAALHNIAINEGLEFNVEEPEEEIVGILDEDDDEDSVEGCDIRQIVVNNYFL